MRIVDSRELVGGCRRRAQFGEKTCDVQWIADVVEDPTDPAHPDRFEAVQQVDAQHRRTVAVRPREGGR